MKVLIGYIWGLNLSKSGGWCSSLWCLGGVFNSMRSPLERIGESSFTQSMETSGVEEVFFFRRGNLNDFTNVS